jgi:predicted dehydrogenase
MKPSAPAVRLALVGYGDIARRAHGPLLAERPDIFNVRAICDPIPGARALAIRDWPSAAVTSSVDMVDLDDVDAALILTSGGHAASLRTLVLAGKPTLVEKPMCFSPSMAREICAAAVAADVPLMVGYMKRYSPAVIAMQSRLSLLGEPLTIDAELLHPIPKTPSIGGDVLRGFTRWLDRAVQGYELVSALGADCRTRFDRIQLRAYFLTITSVIHLLNLTRMLLEPTAIPTHCHLAADGLAGELRLGDGICDARIRWAFAQDRRHSETIAIRGTAGSARIEFPSVYERGPKHTRVTCTVDESTLEWSSDGHGFSEEQLALFEIVRHGRMPLTDAPEALGDLCAAVCSVSLAKEHR